VRTNRAGTRTESIEAHLRADVNRQTDHFVRFGAVRFQSGVRGIAFAVRAIAGVPSAMAGSGYFFVVSSA